MKYLTTIVLTFLLTGFAFSGPVLAAPYDLKTSTPVATIAAQVELLFILRAEHGVIIHDQHGYKLKLTGIDDEVLFFTNRPARDAGQVSLSQFMDSWDKGTPSFKANPPNVIFLHETLPIDTAGFSHGMALVLSNPIATADGWTFDVKAISGRLVVGKYNKVALFIDAWEYNLPKGKKFGAPTIT